MNHTHGFSLIKEQRVAELNSLARWYRHDKSGAQFINVINDDDNKVFGVAFKTLPTDGTGVAHILEHSVLCGSRKYPVKEPFIELAKGSLNTFLNAMTYPDKTVYPVASANIQDLYNLVDVYLDCLFYPNISEWTHKQEGWHYELESADAAMIYKGVVFNEMKGVYSSAESMFYRSTQQALFPDTTYGVDSGGDPREIPNLSYAQFKRFWETNYHPSNARIWWYGNDDADKRLAYLDGWLSAFDARPPIGAVTLQKALASPVTVQKVFDAGEGDTTRKTMCAVNWLITEPQDDVTKLSLEVLGHLLTGTSAAPLRKALVDSGLGEDLSPGTGFRSGLRQDAFSAGLKGLRVEDAAKVADLVTTVLRHHANEGFTMDQVEASLNTIEFRYREANFGSFPRGIAYMLGSLDSWLHDGDPFPPLMYETGLSSLKARLAAGEHVFADLITKHLIQNTHRVTLVMTPSDTYKVEREAVERARLDAARAAMTEADVDQVIADTKTLKTMQVTPDKPEDLAKIPSLHLGDLEKRISTIPNRLIIQGHSQWLHHDLFTNGIVYLEAGFSLANVPRADIPLLALLGRVFLEMGTEREDFAALSRRIGSKTGGVRGSTNGSMLHRGDPNQAQLRFFLSGKSTVAQLPAMLDIMRDVLLTTRLDNRDRFRQMVLENRSRFEAAIVSSGNSFAASRLRAGFSALGSMNEQLGGVSQLFFLRELVGKIDADWLGVQARLEHIRRTLVDRNSTLLNVTLDQENFDAVAGYLTGFVASLPVASSDPANTVMADAGRSVTGAGNEALVVPSQVNYVAKAANLHAAGYQPHGSALVIENFLRTVYLWERVRVQGGAYGGSCGYDADTGVMLFSSYRDPNLAKTDEVYDGAAQFLMEHEVTASEVERCIIGVIGDLDSYQLPDAKGSTALRRWLTRYTDADRQKLRDEVLGTTIAHFRAFGEALTEMRSTGRVVAVGSTSAVAKANEDRGFDWLQSTSVI